MIEAPRITVVSSPEEIIALGNYRQEELKLRTERFNALAEKIPGYAEEFCDLTGASLPDMFVIPAGEFRTESVTWKMALLGEEGNYFATVISYKGPSAYARKLYRSCGPPGSSKRGGLVGISPFRGREELFHEFTHLGITQNGFGISTALPLIDSLDVLIGTPEKGKYLRVCDYADHAKVACLQEPEEFAAGIGGYIGKLTGPQKQDEGWLPDGILAEDGVRITRLNTEEELTHVAIDIIEHWGGCFWNRYCILNAPGPEEAIMRLRELFSAGDFVAETWAQEERLFGRQETHIPEKIILSDELTQRLFSRNPELFVVGTRA